MTHPSPRLVVVEDDPAIRTFLADNLAADGYDLLTADCARDAWRLLETNPSLFPACSTRSEKSFSLKVKRSSPYSRT